MRDAGLAGCEKSLRWLAGLRARAQPVYIPKLDTQIRRCINLKCFIFRLKIPAAPTVEREIKDLAR